MFYEIDTEDSSLYEDSLKLHCNMKDALQNSYYNKNKNISEYSTSYDKTYMRCFKDVNLEDMYRKDTFQLKYRCGYTEDSSLNNTKYSDCLGYSCNKEQNEFLYNLDEFNTYHNYLVCDDNSMTCCPENIQIFNNWTRRHMPVKPVKPPQDIIMDEQEIPKLTYNKCVLYDNK